jgi:hypothetical protein
VDIRESIQYKKFVEYISGGSIQEEIAGGNGYEILAKEYKRELKYTAGNLMQLQLRSLVQKSVDTLVNFFQGFPTLSLLRRALKDTQLRELRPLITEALYVEPKTTP